MTIIFPYSISRLCNVEPVWLLWLSKSVLGVLYEVQISGRG